MNICGVGYGAQPTFVNCADVTILETGQAIPTWFQSADYQSLYASIYGTGPWLTTPPMLSTDKIQVTTTKKPVPLSTEKIQDTTTTKNPIIIVTVPLTTKGTGSSTSGTTETPPSEAPPLVIATTTPVQPTGPNGVVIVTPGPSGTTGQPGTNMGTTTPGTVLERIFGGVFGGTNAGTSTNNNQIVSLLPLLIGALLLGPFFGSSASVSDPSSLIIVDAVNDVPVANPVITGVGMPMFVPDPQSGVVNWHDTRSFANYRSYGTGNSGSVRGSYGGNYKPYGTKMGGVHRMSNTG